MFVRDFLTLARPFAELGPRFARDRPWIEAAMTYALLSVLEDPHDAAPRVRCDWGPARIRQDRIVLPFHSVGAGTIPDVHGDVRITPLGSDRTHVALEGVWQRAGSDVTADGHTVDALAREFLHQLAADTEQR